MLDVKRIHAMIRLNRFENESKKKFLKINGMYRSDYIGMELMKNFFFITVGYLLIVGAYLLYHLEYYIQYWFRADLYGLLRSVVIGYLIVLGFYSVVVYGVCWVRYKKMQKYIKKYDTGLKKMEDLYWKSSREEDV